MRMLPALIIMLTLLLGAHYYVFYRLWCMIPNTLCKAIMVAGGIVALLSPVASLFANESLPSSLVSFMHRVGTSWLIVFLYLLLLFVLLDIIRLMHLLPVSRYMQGSWAGFGAVVLLVGGCLAGGYIHYLHKKRVELALTINKEMAAPLKIVAVSDLHLGYGIGKKEFETWLPLINNESPDVVLIAGDLADGNTRPLFEGDFAGSLRKIRAKYGVYAVLGNHEYIGNVEKSINFFRSAGITLLQDSVALVDNRFYIAGRDDRSNRKRKTLEELIAPADKPLPVILLDHQPVDLAAAERNRVDLQISGHTHHGQVWPVSWITEWLFERAYGYLKKGDTHIYVTSGLGLWGGKFRIGSSSEYVVIRLNSQPQ